MLLQKKTLVIIDTDPGVDDIIAILLALASPELEILAFIVSFGNTDIESSHSNILKAYQAVARHLDKFPSDKGRFPNFSSAIKPILARGSQGPLEGELHSAQYFHGRDGLGEISERHPDLDFENTRHTADHPHLSLTDKSGVDVAIDLIRANAPRSITYIALGPLTTLARIMRQDGNLMKEKIGRIVVMGGALDVPGNTSPVAEFNFFADPFAVKELLMPADQHMGLPLDRLLLLTLDITTPHELPFPVYRENVDSAFGTSEKPSAAAEKPPLTHFTSSFLERTREVMLQFGKDSIELHDIAAVWCAVENPPSPKIDTNLARGWKARRRVFDIERIGEITRGMTVVDRREDESAYAPGANRAEIQAELERSAFSHGTWESTALPAQVEIEHAVEARPPGSGVLCITDTPGPGVLLELLLARVWGIEG